MRSRPWRWRPLSMQRSSVEQRRSPPDCCTSQARCFWCLGTDVHISHMPIETRGRWRLLPIHTGVAATFTPTHVGTGLCATTLHRATRASGSPPPARGLSGCRNPSLSTNSGPPPARGGCRHLTFPEVAPVAFDNGHWPPCPDFALSAANPPRPIRPVRSPHHGARVARAE